LSHKDPNTKTGVNWGRGIQQISPKKQRNKHTNSNSRSPKEGGAVGAIRDGAIPDLECILPPNSANQMRSFNKIAENVLFDSAFF
jgi:hypothetical protein